MDGIINVYKEAGYTSFDVVAKLRGILRQKKIGHTGTLDPDAEGVLPVCVGKATKVCEYLTQKDKVYQATLRLGVTTDTQDMSGRILREQEPDITTEALLAALQSFTGRQKQVPPMYSALKVNGQKLCDLARKGLEVERKAREIEVFSIETLAVTLPLVTIKVHCSKGTYIRTLCQDIGDALGCGGCMEQLLRIKTAGFLLQDACRLHEIEAMVNGTDEQGRKLADIVTPVEEVLAEYPKVQALSEMDRLLQNGNRIPLEGIVSEQTYVPGIYRVYFSYGAFAGLFRYDAARRGFWPEKMFL